MKNDARSNAEDRCAMENVELIQVLVQALWTLINSF